VPGALERPRFTLAQVFFAALAAATLLVGLLLYVFVEGSRAAILKGSDKLRDAAARHVEKLVQAELGVAQGAVEAVEQQLRFRVASADDLEAVEAVLFGELLDRPRLSEITFTRASRVGFDAEGKSQLLPERWQLSVLRAAGEPVSVHTRLTRPSGSRFLAEVRERPPGAPLVGTPMRPVGEVQDPAAHLTFVTTASEQNRGVALWSDLHYSAVDAGSSDQRVVVTVQKAIETPDAKLVGVLRVGLLIGQLDAIARLRVDERDAEDPHRIFLCDEQGRLITRLGPDDRLANQGDELRVVSASPPAPIAAALKSPLLGQLSASEPEASGVLTVSGRRYLVTFRVLRDTRGWNVGIVVPEEYYTRDLERARSESIAVYLLVSALMVAGGILALRALRRGLGKLVEMTGRMRRFDFAPSADFRTAFRDVDEVAESLERAKTVVRAMGKYVPMDLVRQLYESNRDPMLGGELCVVTMMFTDIEGFTTLSEKLAPGELANKLGLYLETMTDAIRSTQGTIDKYIGDAVMALWNVPAPVPRHPQAACRAALACIEATRALYASKQWQGLPPLVTRFGIHTDRVMVGHFGAPARLSYTALGDGVNLAARLEPLCKQYGVVLTVSEAVEAEARDAFAFRRLDRVAVKGKTRGVVIYELLGARGAPGLPLEVARTYEQALDAYFGRRFDEAIAILTSQLADPPSRVLRERCLRLRESPPQEGWDGVYIASSK